MEAEIIDINEKQLALRWNMNAGTLRVWRCVGRGPIYNKRGKKVTYSIADILEYEQKHKVVPANNNL